jgi:hypothetical protein
MHRPGGVRKTAAATIRGDHNVMGERDVILMCPFDLQVIGRGAADHMAGVYLMHTIDAHWDQLERIRRTTGDKDARSRLVQQMAGEMAAHRRSN